MTSTNDGKDVKSNLTSGPKGKTYYIEVYKNLEARLSECTDASERTKHLCEAWRRVHSLCQHSAPSTHLHLLSWLQRHTARTVLQTGWQSPKRKDDRKRLEDAINDFISQTRTSNEARVGDPPPWETQLTARGEWYKTILDKPWDHPVLTLLLNPNGTPPSDEEVLKWLQQERGVTFVMRLHTLVGEKCEDIACSLAACVMERVRAAMPQPITGADYDDNVPDKPTTPLYTGPFADKLRDEAGFTIDVWEMLTDIEFVLQYKRDSQRCIALAKQTPLRGAYQLIERLQCRLETSPREKRLWKNAKEVAILIAKVVIARCMVIPSCTGAARSALYCCARSLAARCPARLVTAAAALAAPAATARHLHTLAAAVRAHLLPSNDEVMKPFVCELYVRAITAGMNELEKLKLKTEKEAEGQARVAAQTLAAWMLQLGSVVAGSRVAAECALTAFSLHPSPHMYECLVCVPPHPQDKKEPKEEATSEFGSWANDSRSMTNFVKTSETLNIKHTQNQANILSTAILNEGEGLGLSAELCQDIAVVLSGPRVKTFSWDMDREELLEKCRVYMERTHGGTRALTTELKYLNLDPSKFQHLPEDRDDDEDDIYYGIEKGYEHLVQFEEPDEIFKDSIDEERTESASSNSLEEAIVARRKKKKNRRISISSEEDCDPLSMVAEAKRHQKTKERPHSKERSRKKKEQKKKEEEVDPLQFGDDNITSEVQEQKVEKTKEKKPRKPKQKAPKVQGDSLSSLVGLKVEKPKKKSKDPSLQSTGYQINDADKKSIDSTFSFGNINSNSSDNISNSMPGYKEPVNDLNNFTYKPRELVTAHRAPSINHGRKHSPNFKTFTDDVRTSISKLLEFRRQKATEPVQRQPKMNAHMVQKKPTNAIINAPDVPIQTNVSPKAVAIPEIPKSYIDKQNAEKLAALKKEVDMIIAKRKQTLEINYDGSTAIQSPVIKYAAKHRTVVPISNPPISRSNNQSNTSSLKMSDIVNVADRQMDKLQRQNSCSAIYDIVRPARPASNASNVAQERPASVAMSGQNDYLHFLKEYQEMRSRAMANDQVLDMSTKTLKDNKKDIKPVSRVAPVVPIPTSNKAERKSQSAKPPIQQKKPDASLNTFSRLSYMHKNKQTEMKNKAATEKSFSFSTYQEVSTELDEIIRKHKNEQMKVIQAKNEKERSKEMPTSSYLNTGDSRKYYQNQNTQPSHPVLSNMLDHNTYNSTPSIVRNENQYKNTVTQQTHTSPPKTSLTSSDQNDILNLLRQQTKLNSAFYQTMSIYPSTSKSGGCSPHSSTMPVSNSSSYSMQQKSNTAKPVSIQPSLETKIINIISNSLIKPADDVSSKISSDAKPLNIGKKNTKTENQNKIKKTDNTKALKEKKPTVISNVKNPNWESVMNDILKHKTPSRGPKALDVALNKSSFEVAFENSLKEPSILPVTETLNERKYPLKGQNSKPVNTHCINITTKKEVKPIQTNANNPKDLLNLSKPVNTSNKKSAKTNSSDICKKMPQEVQRKQFTYTGPKHDDPFISGIPNADYDLLEELMDDDLRKEIGELSSDEESFNTTARTFLETPKSDAKRVSVEFNAQHSEITAKKAQTNTQCLNSRLVNEKTEKISQSHVQCHNIKENNSARNLQGPGVITQTNVTVKPAIAPNVSVNVPTIAHCSNVNTFTNTQINPNIYITGVPQQPPMQNVVLIGSEIVYESYPTVQAPLNNVVTSIAPNAYVAVNNTPNMTLYQPTPFVAPIVSPLLMSNTMSVPIINTVPCAATISVQTPINNVVEPAFHTTPEFTQINSIDINEKPREEIRSTLDPIHNEIKQTSERLQDVNIKINERKVLSEVQEKLAVTENTEKVKIQVTEFEKNIKKDMSDDVERLKKKRMAIINRDIYHRCGNKPIALSYSPLPPIKDIPESLTSIASISQSDEVHEQGDFNKTSIPNNEANDTLNSVNNIADISSPVTPDNNENCKENKNNPIEFRRISLRSSSKSDIEIVKPENITVKKSKVKLKSETPLIGEKADIANSQQESSKDGSTKRISKRIRNRKVNKDNEEKNNVNQKRAAETKKREQSDKKSSRKKPNLQVDNKTIITNNIQNDILDIEAELQGSKIPINSSNSLLITNTLEAKQSQDEDTIALSNHIASREVSIENEHVTQCSSPKTDETLIQTNETGTNGVLNNKDSTIPSGDNESENVLEKINSKKDSADLCPESAINVEKETEGQNLVPEDISNNENSPLATVTHPVVLNSAAQVNDKNNDLQENDDIDLDMMVTEEIIVSQKKLLFADIKYGKAISIADKGKVESKTSNIDKNENSGNYDENGKGKEPVVSISNTNTTIVDDDIEMIDDNFNQSSSVKSQDIQNDTVNSESVSHTIQDICLTNKDKTVHKTTESSSISEDNAINVDDEIQIIGDNMSQSSFLAISDIDQKESKQNVTATHPNHIDDLSQISQSYKDRFIIETLNTGDSSKKCVRVKLPNGKTFKATAYGDIHVNFDTLFANPSVKAILLNSLNNQKRYTMSINQISTVAKSDRTKILSTKIQAINPCLAPGPVETIDLLSDDDDDSRGQKTQTQTLPIGDDEKSLPEVCLQTRPQTLETEFGTFKIATMDKDLLAQHQIKLRHKPIVRLKNLNSSKSNNNADSAVNTTTGLKSTLISSEEINDKIKSLLPTIPDQYISGLINDIQAIEKRVSSDVVEIDDSSNDSTDFKCHEKLKPEHKIDELKDVLLHELGVVKDDKITQKVKASKNVATSEDVIALDDDDDLTNVLPNNSIVTNNQVPNRIFLNDKKSKHKLIDRICSVKLIRCDKLIKQKGMPILDKTKNNKNEENKAGFDSAISSISTCDKQCEDDKISKNEIKTFEDFSFFEPDANAIEPDAERSSSPVIELFDVIASLGGTFHQKEPNHALLALTCEANWFTTKHELHLKYLNCSTILPDIPQDDSEDVIYTEVNNEHVTLIEKPQVPVNVPTLAYLVLNIIQDDNVLSQYKLIRDLNQSLHSLKRKSTSMDASLTPKISKLETTTKESKLNENLHSCDVTLNSSTTDWNMSRSIIEDSTAIFPGDRDLTDVQNDDSMSCTQICDDNHNLNEDCDNISEYSNCKDLEQIQSSQAHYEENINDLPDTDYLLDQRSSSPIIEISHLVKEDCLNFVDDNQISPPKLETSNLQSLEVVEENDMNNDLALEHKTQVTSQVFDNAEVISKSLEITKTNIELAKKGHDAIMCNVHKTDESREVIGTVHENVVEQIEEQDKQIIALDQSRLRELFRKPENESVICVETEDKKYEEPVEIIKSTSLFQNDLNDKPCLENDKEQNSTGVRTSTDNIDTDSDEPVKRDEQTCDAKENHSFTENVSTDSIMHTIEMLQPSGLDTYEVITNDLEVNKQNVVDHKDDETVKVTETELVCLERNESLPFHSNLLDKVETQITEDRMVVEESVSNTNTELLVGNDVKEVAENNKILVPCGHKQTISMMENDVIRPEEVQSVTETTKQSDHISFDSINADSNDDQSDPTFEQIETEVLCEGKEDKHTKDIKSDSNNIRESDPSELIDSDLSIKNKDSAVTFASSVVSKPNLENDVNRSEEVYAVIEASEPSDNLSIGSNDKADSNNIQRSDPTFKQFEIEVSCEGKEYKHQKYIKCYSNNIPESNPFEFIEPDFAVKNKDNSVSVETFVVSKPNLENDMNRSEEMFAAIEDSKPSDNLSCGSINDKADSNDLQRSDQPFAQIETQVSCKEKEDKNIKNTKADSNNIQKSDPSIQPYLSAKKKDSAETIQTSVISKPNLSLEIEVDVEENTVLTTALDEIEESYRNEEVAMLIRNSSRAIIDHEYIANFSIGCEGKCIENLENTTDYSTSLDILDEEATKEIIEEIVEMHKDEVIKTQNKHDENYETDTDEVNILSVYDDNKTEINCANDNAFVNNIPSDDYGCTKNDSRDHAENCDEDLEDTVALWNVSVKNIDDTEETSFTCSDINTESVISKYLALVGKEESDLTKTVKEIRYKDPEVGTCILIPIVDKSAENNINLREKVHTMVTNVDGHHEESNKTLDTESCEDLKIILPQRTYAKYPNKKIRRSKRRINMSDVQFHQKRPRHSKYKKNRYIDYPNTSRIEDVSYAKEYKKMFDYCSTIHFSYSIPFHKEYIDVQEALRSWPIQGDSCLVIEDVDESREMLFIDIPERLSEHIEMSFAEEIVTKYNENTYKSINIAESNFSMGFGDGSGRVKQEQRDGEYTTFSAATLSDVKQIQPLLPSEQKQKSLMEIFGRLENENQDYHEKIRHFYDNLNLKEKVRSFFEKTQSELSFIWARDHKKDDLPTNCPFGLSSLEHIRPAPVNMTVNVVQVGQLPVSAAAQNPVTCDPRVTHVSNVSPSQCSPQDNPGDDLQTSIKTEYTELTTADITLPLMQDYVQHHHSMPNETQESQNLHGSDDNIPMATEIKSVVKIELMEETSQEQMEENIRYETHRLQLSESNVSNGAQYHYDSMTNNMVPESDANVQSVINSTEEQKISSKNKQLNDAEKTDQIAHAMNAAGITASQDIIKTTDAEALVDIISQNAQSDVVTPQTTNYKSAPITSMALQQALAQILPPPLNQTNTSENNQHNNANPQVLHIVQGNNSTPSVINKTNGTQVLHIVQNKNTANGTPASQANTFSGLSLVDGAIQQNGNLLHIVNTGQKNNNNPGQLLKRVNLLTNLANVQGSNDKMVHVLCKSADGKSIQLPTQRSMVLRLQPLDPPNLQTAVKQNDDVGPASASQSANCANGKETTPQEIKSRSLYEENYAKFVQNGDPKPSQEKATSLPKFNQVFGKQVYQDKQNEMENNNIADAPPDCPPEENIPLEQMSDIANPPMLIQKSQNQTTPAQTQPNLVQQIKQTIGPMNIPMHGGVIYTRQIPVNIGNGQTINLITVPSSEIVEDANQKLQADGKFGNQGGDSPIIKIVQNNQSATPTNGTTEDNNAQMGSANDAKPQQTAQPQPVLTQMRIKLPMLSKAPQMVGGTRVVRPSFFQIQRNVIGGANQQVYQQLVLTAAPQIGQSIRLPAQQKPKTPTETQSSPESQMSSSTLEQLREFDMVLEQVKERSTVQPGSSTSSNNFSKLNTSADTTDAATPSTSTLKQDPPTPVLFSVGTTQPINIANFVNRKSTITSTTTSSFVRSPDSTGVAESPSSSTHVHLPHTVATSESCASSSCASEAAAATTSQPKPKKKSKPKSSSSSSNPFKINSTPPKTSTQKPLEDEQTTQRILYILAEYKEQVENSPDKDKPAPRRRNNPAAPAAGTSKRKKSSSGSRKRDCSPIGEDSCRTMGSEDSSCGTSLGECNECLESHSPEESPRKVVRRLTFEQETTQVTQTRTTTIPQRNVIVADGQAFAVRGTTGKPATTVLMPANYLLPVSMVKGGQQIAIVTNRGPKLLVGAGEGGTGGTLLFQRLIGPAGLKPVLTRPGVRHIRLPTAALHNLQTFNIATPAASAPPPDSAASPAPAPAPPDLVDTRAMSSPWPDRAADAADHKPDKGDSSPDGSEPWNLPSSSVADDYGYEEIVRTDNMDRTVLDAIPDRYSPDMEAQRIFDKMFDVDSKKSMYDSRCSYDIDASDDDKAYHQVVQRKDGRHHRLTHVSAAALRHKYAILEHELRLQKSLSEECEDLGVDSPSASELFPEAELLFAPSPAHEQTIDQCHTPQPSLLSQGIPQPDLDDQIASDRLLTPRQEPDDLDINLDDVGEIVTVGEDGMTTIQLDHEEFARSHPNTTFHSEPEDGEIPPFTIAQGLKGRPISFARGVPGTVVMGPQTTVISQATVEATGAQNTVKFTDIDNIINAMPSPQQQATSVLVKDDGLHKYDATNETSAIVHSNGTQVIRRADTRHSDDDALRRDSDERRDSSGDSGPERATDSFWETRRFDEEKWCARHEEAPERLDSVIKAARRGEALRTYPARRGDDEGRRRASNRGVVKRGCHCCSGAATQPRPKKSKKRPGDCPAH